MSSHRFVALATLHEAMGDHPSAKHELVTWLRQVATDAGADLETMTRAGQQVYGYSVPLDETEMPGPGRDAQMREPVPLEP